MEDRTINIAGGKDFIANFSGALDTKGKNEPKKEVELTEAEKLEAQRMNLGPKNFNRQARRKQMKDAGLFKMKKRLIFGSPEWVEYMDKTQTEGAKNVGRMGHNNNNKTHHRYPPFLTG